MRFCCCLWQSLILSFQFLKVNRPLSMKKDGIQTRNRKVSSKNKNKSKGVKQEQKHGGEDKLLSSRDSMPSLSQGNVVSSMISPVLSPTIHTPDCVFKTLHEWYSCPTPWSIWTAYFFDSTEPVELSACATFCLDKRFVKNKKDIKERELYERNTSTETSLSREERPANLVERESSRKKHTSSLRVASYCGTEKLFLYMNTKLNTTKRERKCC